MKTTATFQFASITISFFIHSTEDYQRLLELVSRALSLESESFEVTNLEGYHGNEMFLAKTHITGPAVTQIGYGILQKLDTNSRIRLTQELTKSVDEHDALYLRLDRQELSENSLSISNEEPIRIKLKPKTRQGGKQDVLKNYRDMIEKY